MPSTTLEQYKQTIAACKILFFKKNQDYGTAWRILRLPSLTDQIMIKAKRIRALETQQTQRVQDDIRTELMGIVNYSLMALMQCKLEQDLRLTLPQDELMARYDGLVVDTMELLQQKNHDYQEAWRQMRLSSITDIILMKLLRIQSIESQQQLLVSEGVEAGYQDVMNYAVFALIRLGD